MAFQTWKKLERSVGLLIKKNLKTGFLLVIDQSDVLYHQLVMQGSYRCCEIWLYGFRLCRSESKARLVMGPRCVMRVVAQSASYVLLPNSTDPPHRGCQKVKCAAAAVHVLVKVRATRHQALLVTAAPDELSNQMNELGLAAILAPR
jgi:hypothetical protein